MICIYIYAGSWNVESPSRLSRLAFAKFGIFESVRNLWKKLYRTDLKISEWEHQQSQCDMMHQHREQRKKWGNFARPCRMCIESIRRLDSMPSEPAEAAAKVDPKEQELGCTMMHHMHLQNLQRTLGWSKLDPNFQASSVVFSSSLVARSVLFISLTFQTQRVFGLVQYW